MAKCWGVREEGPEGRSVGRTTKRTKLKVGIMRANERTIGPAEQIWQLHLITLRRRRRRRRRQQQRPQLRMQRQQQQQQRNIDNNDLES